MIVRVNVVPNRSNRTVVDRDSDCRFDNPCGSLVRSKSEWYHVS